MSLRSPPPQRSGSTVAALLPALVLLGCGTLDVQRARSVGAGNVQASASVRGGATLYVPDSPGASPVGRAGVELSGTVRYGLTEQVELVGAAETAFVPQPGLSRFEAGAKWVPLMGEHFAAGASAAAGISLLPGAQAPYLKLGAPLGWMNAGGGEWVLVPAVAGSWDPGTLASALSLEAQLAYVFPVAPKLSLAVQVAGGRFFYSRPTEFENWGVQLGVGMIFGDRWAK